MATVLTGRVAVDPAPGERWRGHLLSPPIGPSSAPSLTSSSASTAASWFEPSTVSAAAPAWSACTLKLDGIRTPIAATQHTVTVVKQTSKTQARLSFYRRAEGACAVKREFRTRTARLGYGGTVKGTERKQGTGTTPRGTYTMTEAFGNGSAPATAMPFHRVRKGDYWVQDNDSAYYNSLRNKADGGFRTRTSENLRGFGKQYRYAVVINFNRAPDFQQRHRGIRHLPARQDIRRDRRLRRRHQASAAGRAALPAARRHDHHRPLSQRD